MAYLSAAEDHPHPRIARAANHICHRHTSPLTATRGIAGDPGTLGHSMPSLEISEGTVEVRERLTRADTAACDLLASTLITRHERVNNALKRAATVRGVTSNGF